MATEHVISIAEDHHRRRDQEDQCADGDGVVIRRVMPVGYRFKPTDEELVRHYLGPKVVRTYVPAHVIQDIDASEFYSTTPSSLVANSRSENKRYFFIHQTGRNVCARTEVNRVIGNGLGFWKPTGGEVPVYDLTGNVVVAFKLHFTYFLGSLPHEAKKTRWKMEEFHLCCTCDATKNMEMEEWVLVRIKGLPD